MKRRYQNISVREKTLLLGFLVLLAFFLVWSAAGHTTRLLHQSARLDTEEATQELWLGQRAKIRAQAQHAARHLEPGKTIDATQLFSEVNKLAQGLNFDLGGQRTEQSNQFAVHVVQLTIRKADLASLIRFYESLEARAPYIGIEQCEFGADRSEAGKLNASLRVFAIQVQPGGTPKS